MESPMDGGQDFKHEGYASSDTGSSNSEELAVPQSSQRRYIGRVKSCGNEYGFIECAETFQRFGRDVHFRTNEVPEHLRNASQCLSFILEVNERGRPQAKLVKGFGTIVEKASEAEAQQVEAERPDREMSPTPSTTSARGLTLTRLTQPKGEPWANIDVEGLDTSFGSCADPRAIAGDSSPAAAGDMLQLTPDEGPAVSNHDPASDSERGDDAAVIVETCSEYDASDAGGLVEEVPPLHRGTTSCAVLGSRLSAEAAPFVPNSSSDRTDRNQDASNLQFESGDLTMHMKSRASQLSADAPEFEFGSSALSTVATDEHATQLEAGASDFWPGHGNPLATMDAGNRATQLSVDAPEFQPGGSTIDDHAPQLSLDAPEFHPGSCWTDVPNAMESTLADDTSAGYGFDQTMLPPPGYEGRGDRKMTQLFANLATKMAETRGIISEYDATQASQEDAWDSYNPGNSNEVEYGHDRGYSWNSSWWKSRDSYRNEKKWSNYDNQDGDRKWWNNKGYDYRKNGKWGTYSDEEDGHKWWASHDNDHRNKHQEQGKGANGGPTKSARRKRKKKRSKAGLRDQGQSQDATDWSSDEELRSDDGVRPWFSGDWQKTPQRPPPYRPAGRRLLDEGSVKHGRDHPQGSRHTWSREDEPTEESDSDQSDERPPIRRVGRWQRGNAEDYREEEQTEESGSETSSEEVLVPRQKPPLRARNGKQRQPRASAQAKDSEGDGPDERPPFRQKPAGREHAVKQPTKHANGPAKQRLEDHEDDTVQSSMVEPLPGHAGIAMGLKTQRYQRNSKDTRAEDRGGDVGETSKPDNAEDEATQLAPAPPQRPRPKEATVDVARFQRMALGHLSKSSRLAKLEVHTNSNEGTGDTSRDN